MHVYTYVLYTCEYVTSVCVCVCIHACKQLQGDECAGSEEEDTCMSYECAGRHMTCVTYVYMYVYTRIHIYAYTYVYA